MKIPNETIVAKSNKLVVCYDHINVSASVCVCLCVKQLKVNWEILDGLLLKT